MRVLLNGIVLVAIMAIGCAHQKAIWPGDASSAVPSAGGAKTTPPLTLMPETLLVGRVVKVNVTGRFVVVSFPLGRMPGIEQRLNVYRRGLKVGDVRITGPQLDYNIVGDIAAGEALVGDDLRDK